MTASVAGKPRAKRPTAAERLAEKDAELAELRRQMAAQTVANAAPLPPSAAAPAPLNGSNGHGRAPAAIPEILRFTTKAADAPEVRIPLFSIDGREYTIPAEPNLTVGLKAYRLAASVPNLDAGEAIALNFILTEMLGADGYDALLSYEDITREQFAKVAEICRGLTLGQIEDPKGS